MKTLAISRKTGTILTMALATLLAGFADAAAEVYFLDSFESGSLSANQGNFRWNSGGSTPTTDVAHTGKYSTRFKFNATPDGKDCSAEQRFAFGKGLPELYVSWYQYFPKGTETFCPDGTCNRWEHRAQGGDLGSANNKWFLMWNHQYNGDDRNNAGYHFWPKDNGNSSISPGEVRECGGVFYHDWNGSSWQLTDQIRGRWIHVEMHFKLNTSTSSPDGRQRLWVDGNLEYDSGNQPWPAVPCNNNNWENLYLMGWSNSGFDKDNYTYIDDFMVSSERISAAIPNQNMAAVTPAPDNAGRDLVIVDMQGRRVQQGGDGKAGKLSGNGVYFRLQYISGKPEIKSFVKLSQAR